MLPFSTRCLFGLSHFSSIPIKTGRHRKPTHWKGLQGVLHTEAEKADTQLQKVASLCVCNAGTTISKNTPLESIACRSLLVKRSPVLLKFNFHLGEKLNFHSYHRHYLWCIGDLLAGFDILKDPSVGTFALERKQIRKLITQHLPCHSSQLSNACTQSYRHI